MLAKKLKIKPKEQKTRFRGILLYTLGTSLLGNLLKGRSTIKSGEGTVRGNQDFKCRLILQLILIYKGIIKTNRNLTVLFE